MAKQSAAPAFRGFERNAMQFWHELASEMSREWFAEHKQRYEDQWAAPMTALLEDVARRAAPAYKPRKLGQPKPLRIYRDVRFSNDKTPYKTHIAGVLRFAGVPLGQAGIAVLYLHLGLDDEYLGNGCYQFDAGKLVKWRRAAVGAPGAALLPIIAKLRKAGYRVRGYNDYQRMPRGFPADHPRAELLKMRGIVCGFPDIPAGLIHKPTFATWLAKHVAATAPLVLWLQRYIG